ncbi:hypothetical protein [Planotetraspora kaengkrachanensis]|uniref:Uncharacterized protein n=1 Tax=Planotetraspora kaengkrachanensis TaxID=575193 RepID=A0A8J3PSG2_9ACTN|nr:hypothetical protein [Planotetraspora kaengkrachanensis]GIG80851.1 hypothetical protein Pka01_39780 [Planotetraspora kaengkrachanensis]
MSTHRSHRIDRFTAERLLRGEPAGPDRLAELLAAAAAPAEYGVQAGEEAAVAAFREAHLIPALQQRKQSMIKTALLKFVTLKVAATLGATAVGSAALVAGTGHLPEYLGFGVPSARPTATHDAGKAPAAGGRLPGVSPSASPSPSTPSPSLAGLCRAYQAGAGGNRGKALDNPAFTRLITVAGGKDKVEAYCADRLKSAGKGPSTRPNDAPKDHPNGASKDHPNGASKDHPNGATKDDPNGASKGRPTDAPPTRSGH